MKKVAVIGGGFRGILATVLLKRAGHDVAVVETAKRIGGILKPIPWNDFSLDIGIQLFDNFPPELESVVREICGDNIAAMDINYATHYGGRTTEAFAILDLCSGDKEDMAINLFDMAVAVGTDWGGPPESLGERNRRAFGERAGAIVNDAAKRMLLIDPYRVEPEYLSATPFNRIRIVPDDVARVLKQAPELDNSIAMNRKALSLSPAANLYPRAGGMASFCAAAEAYCERNGIKILTGAEIASMRADGDSVALERNGETIRFDAAVWTSGARPLGKVLLGEDAMEGLEHPVPMTLYYFRVRLEDCGPYTYVQNHDAALDVFRCSTQGRYGNQVTADGETYVCAESTTMTGEPRWEDPEGHAGQIWDQCVQMGAVSGAPLDCAAFKAPVTYRAPLIGYRDAERRVMDAAAALPALAVMDTRAFTRSAIFATMSNLSL